MKKVDFANFGMATILTANILTVGDPVRKEIPESFICPDIIAAQQETSEDIAALALGARILDPILCNEKASLSPTVLKSENGKLGACIGFGVISLVYGAMGWRKARKRRKNSQY